MRTTVIFRVWLIAIVLLGTGITRAESTTFTGKGSAVIIEGDEAGAARLASKAAMRKAASRAMESLIQKGTKDDKLKNYCSAYRCDRSENPFKSTINVG